MIKYRKINIKEKKELKNLINTVINNLERKEFFIPFTDKEIDIMFDETKAVIYGAYDNDKLIGTAQLYFSDNFVKEIKDILNLNEKVAELGGAVVLKEYRNKGIIKNINQILIKEAKEKGYKYLTVTVHPENIPSNKAILNTGAQKVKTINFGNYLRNIYLLEISNNKN